MALLRGSHHPLREGVAGLEIRAPAPARRAGRCRDVNLCAIRRCDAGADGKSGGHGGSFTEICSARAGLPSCPTTPPAQWEAIPARVTFRSRYATKCSRRGHSVRGYFCDCLAERLASLDMMVRAIAAVDGVKVSDIGE
jgi:hypothetical protein